MSIPSSHNCKKAHNTQYFIFSATILSVFLCLPYSYVEAAPKSTGAAVNLSVEVHGADASFSWKASKKENLNINVRRISKDDGAFVKNMFGDTVCLSFGMKGGSLTDNPYIWKSLPTGQYEAYITRLSVQLGDGEIQLGGMLAPVSNKVTFQIVEGLSLFSWIALYNKDDPDARAAAVEKVDDQAILNKIAQTDETNWVRKAAILKLNDKAVLASIAANSELSTAERDAANQRLTDLKTFATP